MTIEQFDYINVDVYEMESRIAFNFRLPSGSITLIDERRAKGDHEAARQIERMKLKAATLVLEFATMAKKDEIRLEFVSN